MYIYLYMYIYALFQFSIYLLHLLVLHPFTRSRNSNFLLNSHHDGSIFYFYFFFFLNEKHFFKRVMILHSVHVCAVFTCISLNSLTFLRNCSFVLYYYSYFFQTNIFIINTFNHFFFIKQPI